MVARGRFKKQAQEGNSRVRLEMTNKRFPPPQGRAICIDTMSIQYRYGIDTISIRYNTQNKPTILKNAQNYQKIPKKLSKVPNNIHKYPIVPQVPRTT